MLNAIVRQCKGLCGTCNVDMLCSVVRNTAIEDLKPKELKEKIMDAIESKAHMQDVYIADKAYVSLEAVEEVLNKYI